ncbi:hypothetical protein [Streptacidiphilus cavernicola]|uniref:Lipoprotein n=1 Tax=Streptacidiphilus cavernicola TaxID=3342716 RepID=A0ABV6VSQ9_9ACTN
MSSARGLAALTVLGLVALGGTSACASSATTPVGAGSTAGSPSAGATPTPTLVPLPSPGTPTVAPSSPAGPAGPTGTGSARASGIKADSYSTSGNTLTVQFVAGICAVYSLEANQSTPGTVQVTILEAPKGPARQVCPMLVKEQTVSTDLGSPLGSRSVVDTAGGQKLPAQIPVSGGGKVTHGPVTQ